MKYLLFILFYSWCDGLKRLWRLSYFFSVMCYQVDLEALMMAKKLSILVVGQDVLISNSEVCISLVYAKWWCLECVISRRNLLHTWSYLFSILYTFSLLITRLDLSAPFLLIITVRMLTNYLIHLFLRNSWYWYKLL